MNITPPVKITDQKWLNLFKVGWENRDEKGEWIFASRKDKPIVGKEKPEPDAVVIVPIHIAHEKKKLVITREFRISLGDYEYAFPAGIKMSSESTINCASRELKEETGLQLTKIIRISPPVYSSSGLSDESVVMVFCECVGESSTAGLEATEDITTLFLDIEQVHALCTNYTVKHSSKMWPVLFMFTTLGKFDI